MDSARGQEGLTTARRCGQAIHPLDDPLRGPFRKPGAPWYNAAARGGKDRRRPPQPRDAEAGKVQESVTVDRMPRTENRGGRLMLRYIAGAVMGAVIGGLVGYFGKHAGMG